MAEPDGPKLKTWKEIGHYVGRDERTAKRWETSRGLPVRRAPGSIAWPSSQASSSLQ